MLSLTPSAAPAAVEARWEPRPLSDTEFANLAALLFEDDATEQATNTTAGGGQR